MFCHHIPLFSSGFSVQTAIVDTQSGKLQIRSAPSHTAPVCSTVREGTHLTIRKRCGNWFSVQHGRTCGYVSGDEVVLSALPAREKSRK
ncbi:MAG: SH3 domain-containing protein [Agathobaculum sp.]|jgi:SH3-like domain-containing protein|uniref:SH3 domain-containing protein n=1 Tax=Agathobaculum sp. TaxID=2048138 RepID=UPI003D8FFA1E